MTIWLPLTKHNIDLLDVIIHCCSWQYLSDYVSNIVNECVNMFYLCS